MKNSNTEYDKKINGDVYKIESFFGKKTIVEVIRELLTSKVKEM